MSALLTPASPEPGGLPLLVLRAARWSWSDRLHPQPFNRLVRSSLRTASGPWQGLGTGWDHRFPRGAGTRGDTRALRSTEGLRVLGTDGGERAAGNTLVSWAKGRAPLTSGRSAEEPARNWTARGSPAHPGAERSRELPPLRSGSSARASHATRLSAQRAVAADARRCPAPHRGLREPQSRRATPSGAPNPGTGGLEGSTSPQRPPCHPYPALSRCPPTRGPLAPLLGGRL